MMAFNEGRTVSSANRGSWSSALHHPHTKDQTLSSTTRKALDARLLLKPCKLAYRVLEKGRRSFVHTPECDERAPRLGRENHQDVQYWRYIDCRGGVRAELLRSPGPRRAGEGTRGLRGCCRSGTPLIRRTRSAHSRRGRRRRQNRGPAPVERKTRRKGSGKRDD